MLGTNWLLIYLNGESLQLNSEVQLHVVGLKFKTIQGRIIAAIF